MKTSQHHSMLILFSILICWLIPNSSYAYETLYVDDIHFNVDITNKTAEVTSGFYNSYEGDVIIPTSFEYDGSTYIVTGIDDGAFRDCSFLTSVTVPKSVTSIGSDAFSSCTGLYYVIIESATPPSIGNDIIQGSRYVVFFVPAGCTSAYESAEGWKDVKRIVEYGVEPYAVATGPCGAGWYDDSVIYTVYSDMTMVISGDGYSMMDFDPDFQMGGNRWPVKKVIIDDGIKCIGEFSFFASTMTSVEIPSSVTTIGDHAFECSSLTSVTLPDRLTSIGSNVFAHCQDLTYVDIPPFVTSIGECAFEGCYSLASIDIPSSVTSIGTSAFWGCGSLTSIDIPNSVTSISKCTFTDCYRLASAVIPNSVTSIGSRAFSECASLTSITVGWETPLTINSDVFENVDKSTCTLYVPAGSKSAYESAEVWEEFNIVELDTDIFALENVIYVDQTDGRIGGTMDIPVKLKSDFAVRGFQFTMELPEGTTVNSWKMSTDRLPSGATESDKISSQGIDGNKISVACSLNYEGKTFTGNDGVVATVNVTFSEDMEEGSYPIYLTECSSSDATGYKNPELSDVKSTLFLESYVPGDANGDGRVMIGDVTAILNYIVGVSTDTLQLKAADVNGDGKVLIGDVIAILNLIVDQ